MAMRQLGQYPTCACRLRPIPVPAVPTPLSEVLLAVLDRFLVDERSFKLDSLSESGSDDGPFAYIRVER